MVIETAAFTGFRPEAIDSETRTAYGSRVCRKANWRPFATYHARIASRAGGGTWVGVGTRRG